MTENMPWFKFYSEALNDRKIVRTARMAQQPKAIVMGVWLTLLCLANESPERGRLMIAEDLWFEEEEIAAETGLDPVTFGKVVGAFQKLGMVSVSAGYEISNWNGRQSRQYSQTPEAVRQRKHRAMKKKEQEERSKKKDLEMSRDSHGDMSRKTSQLPTKNRDLPSLPPYLAVNPLLNAWGEWVQYHIDRGRPLTTNTALKQFKRFEQMGNERAAAAIEFSIESNYTALIEPKISRNGQEQAADRKRRLEEMLANEGLA